MKILLITRDADLKQICRSFDKPGYEELIVYDEDPDPLKVLSRIMRLNPTILIVDDDFLQPHTEELIRSIREVKEEMVIVFVTSDNSLKLGREISGLGVQRYVIKPLSAEHFSESLQWLVQTKKREFH